MAKEGGAGTILCLRERVRTGTWAASALYLGSMDSCGGACFTSVV